MNSVHPTTRGLPRFAGRAWSGLLLAASALAWGAPAAAQSSAPLFDYPVHIAVPFSAGGTVDVAARVIAQGLQKRINQSVVVENKPGAGGNIAAVYVAHAPASQPTLLVTMVNHFVNPVIFKDPGYDPDKDFVPILQLGTSPYVFVVPGNSRFKSLSDVAAYAKANPGKLAWGFGGIGSPGHFFGIEFARAAQVQTNPISYRGGPDLLTAVGGGQVDMVVMSAETSLPLIREGKLKALASTGERRNAALPDVPTASEQIAGYAPLTGYTIMLAAPTIPRDKLMRLHDAVVDVVKSPEYQASLQRVGATVTTTATLEESRAFFQQEGGRWRAIATESGLQIQ
ncbi:Bug family tripartite tricarboxylate transporter substrate binding protein [Bordetella sp. H567]|uniref:Bug family tripartite tricarboxylate transporter substrate binding protein n=1 Tax=Bordetella sp. H567 TaxID=1697043 RepID=UPI00082D84AD|nr:tripartite tricarboxylate transporter substrate binding protein [Bordetella sp. H567]